MPSNESRGAEFTSGFSKDDRLIPVITLAVYWGTEPWDGPRNLHEMLDIPRELLHYKDKIGNYGINLLEVQSIENLEQYSGERIGEARGKLMGINAMITDNLEEGAAECRIVEKLKKHFSLTEKDAMEYLRRYQERQLQS